MACLCLLAGLSGAAVAQTTDAPPQSSSARPGAGTQQPSSGPKPCSVIPDPDPCAAGTVKPASSSGFQSAPSAADKFPFPGSDAATSSSAPGIGSPTAPEAPAASSAPVTPPTDASKKFPFPGEAPSQTSSPDLPAASAAGAASSSSSSSSSSDDASGDLSGSPDLTDAGTEGSQTPRGGHILHRAAPAAPKPQTTGEREEEDLRVANFNLDGGNVRGAYLRAQDAVKTAPDDPEAHFALAETAAKLGKKDEAIAEYNACLKLDPSDERKRDSDKALARLTK